MAEVARGLEVNPNVLHRLQREFRQEPDINAHDSQGHDPLTANADRRQKSTGKICWRYISSTKIWDWTQWLDNLGIIWLLR